MFFLFLPLFDSKGKEAVFLSCYTTSLWRESVGMFTKNSAIVSLLRLDSLGLH